MKINYDQIIELANLRKNALIDLSKRLEGLPKLVADAKQVHSDIIALQTAFTRLDVEGQKLLPPNVLEQLHHLRSAVVPGILNVLEGRDSYSGKNIGLASLLMAVKANED